MDWEKVIAKLEHGADNAEAERARRVRLSAAAGVEGLIATKWVLTVLADALRAGLEK
jgi:hypothetical protein